MRNLQCARSLLSFCAFLCIDSLLLSFFSPIVLAQVKSTNYQLRDYNFGAGGADTSNSTNYSMSGISGQTGAQGGKTANYQVNEGLQFTIQANVPPAPTFSNPGTFYNKLNIILNNGSNPTDAKFAIAISADNFASDTRYIQNDNSIGASLGLEDWQTYTTWGGGSGFTIGGLLANTTYTVKVAAKHGNYTETGFGPTAQAATINPTLTFDVDVSSSDTDTTPPFAINLGTLSPGTVTTSSEKVWVDIDTNGTSGASVYLSGANSGLLSSATSNTITSSTADLTGATTGYGAKSNSVTQTSGGPMQAVSPYNGSGENVGLIDTSKRLIFDSSTAPVTAGRVSFVLKAKASSVTEAANDYSDTLTILAIGRF